MYRNMYTLKSKLIHAFYWTHFEDNNCSLMNKLHLSDEIFKKSTMYKEEEQKEGGEGK